jgi:hypothetical protein
MDNQEWLVSSSPQSTYELSNSVPADYSTFSSPDFGPNEYANANLATDTYPPTDSKVATRGSSQSKGAVQDSIAKEDPTDCSHLEIDLRHKRRVKAD